MEILIFDTETSGLNPSEHQIIEFGLIKCKYENGNFTLLEEDNFLIKCDTPLDSKITEITGITDERLKKEGITKAEAYKRIKPFVKDGIIIAGYNVQFDLKFLDSFIKDFEPDFKFKNDFLCAMTLFRDFYKYPNRLKDAIEVLQIEGENTHRASDDAKATMEVFKILNKKLPELTGSSNASILDFKNYFGFYYKYPVQDKLPGITYIAQGPNARKEVWSFIEKIKR